MWNTPECADYIESLLEAAMTRKIENPDLDIESYEEVRALAMEMELDPDMEV